MNPLAAARALADWWPAQATVAPETGRSTCIESTRIVCEAFRRCGVTDVKPLPCELHLYNPALTVAVMSNTEPTHSAVHIEISPEKLAGQLGKGSFAAHLIAEHPTFLLDLTAGGVVRSVGSPAGFESVGPFCAEKGHDIIEQADDSWVGLSLTGVLIRFVPRRKLSSWRNTDAWRGDVDEVADVVADALRGSDAD